MMLKTLSVLVGGIFVGAVAVEILRKNRPDLLERFYADGSRIARGIKTAFKEGYESIPNGQDVEETVT